jgi:Amt family ammonium transporter
MGALDFAGGIVVHITAGVSAMAIAMVIGVRKGFGTDPMEPHNIPTTVMGAALLRFGWFGFNAGSALAANGIAANAFVTTNTAAAAAGLTWALLEWWKHGAPTVLGVVSGAVAGLVAITPACGFVSPLSSIAIGIIGGIVCFGAVTMLKPKLGYDDALDVFGVHCVGGTWGTLATGLFAQKVINEAGTNGFFFGNPKLLLIQSLYLGACMLYAAAMTWILYKLVDSLIGMRVTEKQETIGLDLTQHSEAAYTVIE